MKRVYLGHFGSKSKMSPHYKGQVQTSKKSVEQWKEYIRVTLDQNLRCIHRMMNAQDELDEFYCNVYMCLKTVQQSLNLGKCQVVPAFFRGVAWVSKNLDQNITHMVTWWGEKKKLTSPNPSAIRLCKCAAKNLVSGIILVLKEMLKLRPLEMPENLIPVLNLFLEWSCVDLHLFTLKILHLHTNKLLYLQHFLQNLTRFPMC